MENRLLREFNVVRIKLAGNLYLVYVNSTRYYNYKAGGCLNIVSDIVIFFINYKMLNLFTLKKCKYLQYWNSYSYTDFRNVMSSLMRIERRSLDQNCINYKSQAIVLPEPRVEINSLSAISGHTDIPESRAARADFSLRSSSNHCRWSKDVKYDGE